MSRTIIQQIATLEGAGVDKDKLAVLLSFVSNEPTEKSFKAFKAALLGEEDDEDEDDDGCCSCVAEVVVAVDLEVSPSLKHLGLEL